MSSPFPKPDLKILTFDQILSNLKTKPVPQPCPSTAGGRSGDTIGFSLSSAGGYEDEIFLTRPPKDLQCIVCLMVVREPHLITCCGAIICKFCMSLSNAKEECPQCRDTMDHLVVPDKRTRGQTMSLEVKCTNTGCKWTGELLDYHEHVNEKCTMCSVACRYGCGQYFKGADISIHEQANCVYRPYDVIMRYQERLVQAMEDRESKRIEEVIDEMAKGMSKLELDNQQLKKDLFNSKDKSKHSVVSQRSLAPFQRREPRELCFDSSTVTCPSCYFPFCKNCMNPAHGFNSLSIASLTPIQERSVTRQMSQKCPVCGTAVQPSKMSSLNSIICNNCKCNFCFLCSIPWNSKCKEKHEFGIGK